MARPKYPSDENRDNSERPSPRISITIPREVLEQLEALGLENRSEWIVDAIERKLKRQ